MFKFNNGTLSLIFVYFPTFSSTAFFPVFFSLNVNLTCPVHYYPYGGTAIIASKDKTQAQQKRYRYTGKERDDNSGLYYYGARYLAPWLARWISPDSQGVDGCLCCFH
jgi:RHS repeat-associated protein